MPLGLAARLNLAAARVAGSLHLTQPTMRPCITSAGFVNHPVVGQPATLKWRTKRAGAAFLHIEQPEGVVLCHSPVVINGTTTIPILAPTPIYVWFRLEPRQLRTNTEQEPFNLPPVIPVLPRPRFVRLDVPATASLHGTFDVVWDAGDDATGVDLIINDGRRVIKETHYPSGVRTIVASRAGKWVVRLTAQGTHRAVTASRIISVEAPAPRIDVERRVIAGPPGMEGTFVWHMTDAVRAYLHAPLRNQRCEAPLEGGLPVTVGEEPEYFYLVAIGIDGRRTRVELRTEPYNLSLLSPEA